MTKGSQIRELIRRGNSVNTLDLARAVGCTQPRVCQVIREMQDAGEQFEHRNLGGGRTSWRLLGADEIDERRRLKDSRDLDRERADLDRALLALIDEIANIRRRVAALA